MSKVAIKGATTGTGTFTIESPATNTDRTLVLPDNAGTVLTSASNLAGVAGVGKVLQVVQSSTTTLVTSSVTGATSIGLTGTITPSSTSSRILVFVTATYTINVKGTYVGFTLFRGTTSGTNLGSAVDGLGGSALALVYKNNDVEQVNFQFLDSPSTASAQVYTAAVLQGSPAQTVAIQQDGAPSYMLLMEIAA